MNDYEPTRVLITVMTYPHPSMKHRELVCTAGLSELGEWIRLYPIDYRYRPRYQQFHKYQWVEVGLRPRGSGNDGRKESREPDLASLRILGEPLDTSDGWAKRRAIIDGLPRYTRNQLERLYDLDQTSLGIVRPTRILELKIERADANWKPEWQSLFSQLRLFGPPQKPLRKLPYKFSYIFECEDSQKPHSAMIEDWELGALYLKEADRLGSDEAAADSVRDKYLRQMCGSGRDTQFFMGTVFPWNSWVVIGVYWPPKTESSTAEAKQTALPI